MKFRPLGDRVVVRRVKEDQKTPGGIIIPDTVAEKPQEGEVISVGPGALDESGKRVVPVRPAQPVEGTPVAGDTNTPAAAMVGPVKKPAFTKKQVASRLRDLKRLYEEGLLTDEFYWERVAECDVAQ